MITDLRYVVALLFIGTAGLLFYLIHVIRERREPIREDIKLFLKLPSKFTIPTPVGDYNPDWAIVKEVNGVEKIYMVRETKNGGEREDELHKIACAKKHFETIDMCDYAKSTPDDWRV